MGSEDVGLVTIKSTISPHKALLYSYDFLPPPPPPPPPPQRPVSNQFLRVPLYTLSVTTEHLPPPSFPLKKNVILP